MTMALMVDPKVSERLILAVVLSIGLHVAILFTIQAKPDAAGSSATAPITATLERSASSEDSTLTQSEAELSPSLSAQPDPAPNDATAPAQSADAPPSSPVSAPLKPEPAEANVALEVPVIRDPTFYAARFLDEYPRPIAPIEPRYPAQASQAGVSGKVTLLLLIDEHGTLHEISVVEAAPEQIFDEAALAAFRDARFFPARKDGRAVRSRVLITVGFEANKPASLQ